MVELDRSIRGAKPGVPITIPERQPEPVYPIPMPGRKPIRDPEPSKKPVAPGSPVPVRR